MAEEILYKNWINKGKKLFGENKDDWIFICPSCNHKQSVNSVLEHNSQLEREVVRGWIFFNCEGRKSKGYGCSWTLGGFLQIHSLEIMFDDKSKSKAFHFAMV